MDHHRHSLFFFSGRKSVENIPTISAIGLTPLRMNRYRKTITFISYMEILLKRSPTQRFRTFWRNCSFCWAPFYLLYHLNLVILAKTAISKIFRNFWWNCRNRSFCWASFYIYYHLNLVIFNKNCDFKNFPQFLLLRENLDISRSFWVGVSCWDPGTLSLCQSLYKCNCSAVF